MDCVQDFIQIGLLLKPFGIKGAMKIHFYVDNPSDLSNVKVFYIYHKNISKNYEPLYFKSIHFDENGQFAKGFFEGISDRTSAEQYRLTPIFIKKENLPSLNINEYFIHDLLNLKVEFESTEIGFIANIISTGNRDIFIIQLYNKKQYIAVPFIDYYVVALNLKERIVIMSNLDELF